MTDQENDILWNEYFYPGSTVLINHFGYHNAEQLKEAEATNSFDRLMELRKNPLNCGFGKKQLNSIHKYIFDDIYPFAGEYRVVNMQKEVGTFLFINSPEDIDYRLDELFEEIEEKINNCRNEFDFSNILAELYTKLIYIHPYREGNGRTIREFLREYSLEKSKKVGLGEVELDWTKINKDELNEYIDVAHIFPGGTASLFREALVYHEDSKIR